MGDNFRMVAKTLFGFEEILAKELRNLGAGNVEEGVRNVAFDGDLGFMYKANLCLRTAIKIIKPINSFQVRDEKDLYQKIYQMDWTEYLSVDDTFERFKITTNKNVYYSKIVILALNYSKPFTINGLDNFIESHKKTTLGKDRIQLKNKNHLIKKGLYCCGTIAGHRSQFAIAAGSGASVATDILTLWNGEKHVKIHDKV